ncbi:hypothetical protein RJ640_011231 [Escallonia rubra]|uniref:Methyltransferase type 11 domain-containing protein n=1 Tax=Escallonia rubra TaxID=112253 RepID=A0AA88RMN4_9ASTE|nr:hypothetical protein RJ640_011231 [Escallonia rubra]
MERHIQAFLNKLSYASITIATLTLLLLFLHTPDTCLPSTPTSHFHQKFPKSTCDATHRPFTSLHKRNRRLRSTKSFQSAVASFASLFSSLQNLTLLPNHSRVLCLSAGAGQPVLALNQIGVDDVTGVELVDSPPLVSRADPHNLPFFDNVFDLGFSAHFDQALFPSRYAAEMERTVRVGGVCVVVVEECGDGEAGEVAKLFARSRFVGAKNITLTGSRMTRIIMKITVPP